MPFTVSFVQVDIESFAYCWHVAYVLSKISQNVNLKSIPLEARIGPEVCRILRLPQILDNCRMKVLNFWRRNYFF